MAFLDNINKSDAFVTLYELWGRRTPSYEKHYEQEIIRPLTDFGKGTNESSESKAKILGAGYEVLIMAFFIGLYSDKRKPLNEDEESKDLGQPLQFWGNVDSKKGRKAYPRLREYIFIALVTKTKDIDWLKLDMGKLTPNETVSLLLITMEEYINYGLSVMAEKMKDDEGYFLSQDSFLNLFQNLTRKIEMVEDNDEPESLD